MLQKIAPWFTFLYYKRYIIDKNKVFYHFTNNRFIYLNVSLIIRYFVKNNNRLWKKQKYILQTSVHR